LGKWKQKKNKEDRVAKALRNPVSGFRILASGFRIPVKYGIPVQLDVYGRVKGIINRQRV
jgi:hypothetical protein